MEITLLRSFSVRALLLVLAMLGGAAWSDEPAKSLALRIDDEIAARAGGALAGPATDEEFLRRVFLDLTGSIPASREAAAFLADAAADKRAKLIDSLLASPAFARRMREAWTVMLLERQEVKAISDDEWNEYLRGAFATNKPWDALVRELLAADGFDEATRPAIRFFADGARSDPHQRTQDFARLFLGMNLQCAQCHDHPTIADYKQTHYYGLFAFLSPAQLAKDKEERAHLIDAPVKGKIDFVSVFLPNAKHTLGPKLLESPEVTIPPLVAGEEFAQPAEDGLPGVPKFQPRKLLAQQLTSAPLDRRFARSAVNRFWFLMFGRGIVHPLDLDHSANPPSHPVLLDLLTESFIASRYDVRELVRQLCLTQAYQRTSCAPTSFSGEAVRPESYRLAMLRPLAAEQLARSVAEATGRRQRLDEAVAPAQPLTYKDYANGRTELPNNWRDVMIVFAGTFGHPAGQPEVDFRPSVEQALFLANERLVRNWLEPQPDTLMHRLNMLETAAAIDELYLSMLTRLPTPEERELANSLLDARVSNTSSVWQDLSLALLMSAEFRMNH